MGATIHFYDQPQCAMFSWTICASRGCNEHFPCKVNVTFAVLVLINTGCHYVPGRRGYSFTCHLSRVAFTIALDGSIFQIRVLELLPAVSTTHYRLVEKLAYILATVRVS